MVFDQFCGLVERHIPHWKSYVESAKIFSFPNRAHEVLPKSFAVDRVDFYKNYFFLPFRTIAIEDKTSVIILHDTIKDAKGLSTPREFIECLPLDRSCDDFGDSSTYSPIDKIILDQTMNPLKGYYLLTKGAITVIDCESSSYLSYGMVAEAYLCNKNKILKEGKVIYNNEQLVRSVLRNINTAIEEVMYFNSPDRFVVEVVSKNVKNRPNNPKIQRSDERSKFIILHPTEIRKKFKLDDSYHSSGKTVSPHPRRRHYRTYEDDRFVYMKGKTVIIPATWVGPTEVKIESKIYRIRLDI